MKKVLVASIIGLLVMTGIYFAFAAESNVPASVTVNSYASVTITPCAGTLSFGSGNPGDNDLAVTCQGAGAPAANVSNDVVSNTNINVETKGTDFTYLTNTIAVNKLEFDESNAKPSATILSAAYQPSTSGVTPGTSAGIWYWIDIPSTQAAGTYSGTISVKGA